MTRIASSTQSLRLSVLAGLVATAAVSTPALAQDDSRLRELPVTLSAVEYFGVTTLGQRFDRPLPTARSCSGQSTHTDASFTGNVSLLGQGGTAEGEIAAASYTLPASAFPIRIDQTEMIFVTQNAVQTTTTEYSMLIWEGTPDTGTLIAEFSSDGDIIPHLTAGPGTTGTNIVLQVDAADSDQIFIFNNSGTNTFSVGYRIDAHNVPGTDPCSVFGAPPSNRNAFPATDNGDFFANGLAVPSGNWIFGLNCSGSLLECIPGGGWTTFSASDPRINSLCIPSGDWMIRASWTSVNCQPGVGACCYDDGTCGVTFVGDCDAAGGVYQGDGSTCETSNCPQPASGVCCSVTGDCIPGVSEAICLPFDGTWAADFSNCADANTNGVSDACEPTDVCLPDVNDDGLLDIDDFSGFVAAFFANDLVADQDQSGSLDIDDFSQFVTNFFMGC